MEVGVKEMSLSGSLRKLLRCKERLEHKIERSIAIYDTVFDKNLVARREETTNV
jgi:hypothetical protein